MCTLHTGVHSNVGAKPSSGDFDSIKMEKHLSPPLPTSKQLLEDFSDSDFMPQKYSKELSLDDELLQKTYKSFLNIRQLDKDIKQHSNFNSNLEELTEKLAENIASLKNQSRKK